MRLRRFFQTLIPTSLLVAIYFFIPYQSNYKEVESSSEKSVQFYWKHYFDDWKDVTDNKSFANASISIAIPNVWPYMRVLLSQDNEEIWDSEFQPLTEGFLMKVIFNQKNAVLSNAIIMKFRLTILSSCIRRRSLMLYSIVQAKKLFCNHSFLGDFVKFSKFPLIADNPEIYKVSFDLESASLMGPRTKASDSNLGDLQVHTVSSITEVPGLLITMSFLFYFKATFLTQDQNPAVFYKPYPGPKLKDRLSKALAMVSHSSYFGSGIPRFRYLLRITLEPILLLS